MSPPAKRLRRSRVACEPCRIRKRRCDGQQPCETCTQFAYDCFYDVNTRKKRNKGPITRSPALPTPVAKPRSSPEERTRSEPPAPVCTPASQDTAPMESNSGAAFVRRLGLTLDPANAPEPQIFAWNIGTRPLPGTYPALPPTETISQAEMQRLSQIFFDKVSTVYGFLDRETCNNAIQTRWHRPPTLEPYDTVLCGIAAIGYLFSERKPVAAELHLVETARTALEHNSMSMAGVPSPTLIFGWTLRLMYLRLAGTPHPAWMVSCNLLHMIDAGGFHLDPKGDAPALVRPPPNIDPDIRRRLVAYVQYVNTWISYDLGRSRVQLYGAPYTSPSPTDPGDYTAEMLDLLPLSEILAPHKPADPEQLATLLTKVLDSERTQAPYILSQCNLALCIFRRLRVLCGSKATNSDNDIAPRILTLCTKALASARDLLNSLSPWSHVANVPFQIVYTMLVIDTPDSTTILADAMQTLRLVVELYDTESLHDAYCAAGRLVYLQQRAKEKEVRRLKEIIEGHLVDPGTGTETQTVSQTLATEHRLLELDHSLHLGTEQQGTEHLINFGNGMGGIPKIPGFGAGFDDYSLAQILGADGLGSWMGLGPFGNI